jgi:hypothetical protein
MIGTRESYFGRSHLQVCDWSFTEGVLHEHVATHSRSRYCRVGDGNLSARLVLTNSAHDLYRRFLRM